MLIFGMVAGIMSNPESAKQTMTKLENIMENMASTYFETYTIEENENKFYINEGDWKYMSFSDRKNLMDLAARTAASKREKAYQEQNPNEHKYFSKMSELNKTKIYSANNKDKLLGEFYLDENLYNGDELKFTDIIKASVNAYKFYNP